MANDISKKVDEIQWKFRLNVKFSLEDLERIYFIFFEGDSKREFKAFVKSLKKGVETYRDFGETWRSVLYLRRKREGYYLEEEGQKRY